MPKHPFDPPKLSAAIRNPWEVRNEDSRVEHEATTSKIGEEQLFYFQQRGIDAEKAVGMIISGFCQDVRGCAQTPGRGGSWKAQRVRRSRWLRGEESSHQR